MRYKCIELTKNKAVIQGSDNSILEFYIPDEPTGREFEDIFIRTLNLRYDNVNKYRLVEVNRETMMDYLLLIDSKSKQWQKTYLKAQTLNKLYIPDQKYDNDYIVFTDKNDKIKKDTIIRVNTVHLVGNKHISVISDTGAIVSDDRLNTTFSDLTQIKCKEAILENLKIYSKLIDRYIVNGLLEAQTLILKHSFINLCTIEEVLCIFKETCGIDTVNEFHGRNVVYEDINTIRDKSYTKIIIKFNNINLDDAVHKTLTLVEKDDELYSKEDIFKKVRRDVATSLFLISMWISCSKDDRILSILKIKIKELEVHKEKQLANMYLSDRLNITLRLFNKEINNVL